MDWIPTPIAPPHAAPAPAPLPGPGHASADRPEGAAPPKVAADYLRALRRRLWLVPAVAVLVLVPGTIYVTRLPDRYQAVAHLHIEPPTVDQRVATIIPNGHVGQTSPELNSRYVPDKVAYLKGPRLAQDVAALPELQVPPEQQDGVAQQLMSLQARPQLNSGTFIVTLEGTDRTRVAALLNAHLEQFAQQVQQDSLGDFDKARRRASENVAEHERELAALEREILALVNQRPIFSPDGHNMLDDQYTEMKSLLLQKRLRYAELEHQRNLGAASPLHAAAGAAASPLHGRIAQLHQQKEDLADYLEEYRRTIKKFETDPASRAVAKQLEDVMDELAELEEAVAAPQADLAGLALSHAGEEVVKLEKEVKGLLDHIQATMPDYQEFMKKVRERAQKEEVLAKARAQLDDFTFLAETVKAPVEILFRAEEPEVAVGPNRKLSIVLLVLLGFGGGIGLVCALETFDHRVKAPEHLADGLRLPLVGVVPRMRRLAELHRGGHLWTPGLPRSAEADAFRNIRASLLGLTGAGGRAAVTLLITSAKAGEGKSTTALNLAATCARAGERTLLIDADFRRPSLGPVFATEPALGLADVLREDLPWPRTLLRTGVPNLDFMPVGDVSDTPIELLGTLEMHQLLAAVAGHYHRVIIDGPAVLGLADCRMVGRMVDAALLVVRAGVHDLSPLRRAKGMLEQSRVPIGGVVFNGLADDLANWSSHLPPPSVAPQAPRVPAGRAALAEPAAAAAPSA
jgi:capsular exopolysaccharide synthesis family protein